jgi:hypothetical protein
VVPETRAPEACPADGETDHGVEKHDDPEEDEWLTF